MKRVLFISTRNSSRSQMAEAYLNALGGGEYQAESAGLDPKPVNPYVIEVMHEDGIDISDKQPRDVVGVLGSGRLFHFVVTVCGEADEKCPVFPGVSHRLHVPFADPSTFTGTREEILQKTREVRDAIKAKIKEFLGWCDGGCLTKLGGPWKHT